MKTAFLRNAALGTALALAACASGGPKRAPAGPGVDVARFHLGETVARAQIAIEPKVQALGFTTKIPHWRETVTLT